MKNVITELAPSEIAELAEKRIEEIRPLLLRKKKDMEKKPSGKLRIITRKRSFQYYLRTRPEDTEGKYIKKSSITIAKDIAQYEYDRKLIDRLEQQIGLLEKVKETCGNESLLNIQTSLHPGKQVLLSKAMLTDEEYKERWLAFFYEQKKFFENDNSQYYTARNERVRSKSEIMIADALVRYGIPYRYEFPVKLLGYGTVHPDFYCLNVRTRKEFAWEHFGIMSDYTYANENVRKIDKYLLNGFLPGVNFIMTFETDQNPLNTKTVNKIIEEYLL